MFALANAGGDPVLGLVLTIVISVGIGGVRTLLAFPHDRQSPVHMEQVANDPGGQPSQLSADWMSRRPSPKRPRRNGSLAVLLPSAHETARSQKELR